MDFKLYYTVSYIIEWNGREKTKIKRSTLHLSKEFWILWWIESWKPAMTWVCVTLDNRTNMTLSSWLSVLSKGDFIGFGEW